MTIQKLIVAIFLLLSVLAGGVSADTRCSNIRIKGNTKIFTLHEITEGPTFDDLNAIRAEANFREEVVLCGGFPAKYGMGRAVELFGRASVLVSSEILRGFSRRIRKGFLAHEFCHIYLGHHKIPNPDEKQQALDEAAADVCSVQFVGKRVAMEAINSSARAAFMIDPDIDREDALDKATIRIQRIMKLPPE